MVRENELILLGILVASLFLHPDITAVKGPFLIGCCDYFGFGFTTIDRKVPFQHPDRGLTPLQQKFSCLRPRCWRIS